MARNFRHSKNWGGERPGAGRPKEGSERVRVNVTLPVELLEWLDKKAGHDSLPRSKVMAQMLEKAITHSE